MNDSIPPDESKPNIDPSVSSAIEANDGALIGGGVSRYRVAIIASIIFHVVLVAALAIWYLPKLYKPTPNSAAAAATDDGASSGASRQATPDSQASVPDELVETSIQMQIDKASKMSDEEKLSELEKNLKRLESIASQKSVNQITDKVGSSLGLDSQQYQPKETAVSGVFDTSTAQMTDVVRSKDASGQWEYRTTMVDAAGRELDVPISAAEGESLYQTFQQIKKFPMAAGIYRRIVMPMMQKILSAQDAAAEAAKEAERMEQQKSVAPTYGSD